MEYFAGLDVSLEETAICIGETPAEAGLAAMEEAWAAVKAAEQGNGAGCLLTGAGTQLQPFVLSRA